MAGLEPPGRRMEGVEGAAGQPPEARGWVGPGHRMQEMGGVSPGVAGNTGW